MQWKTTSWLAIAIACACIERGSTPQSQEVSTPAPEPTSADAPTPKRGPAVAAGPTMTGGQDVLAEMRKANGKDVAAPPDEFRTGHATPRRIDANATTRNADGFRVKLPSGAPITTPAAHAGLVITSGGFHSKEIYAFHAKTGAFAWGLDLDDDGPSAPACDDGVCVFNTESCTVFAVEAKSGELLWSWWLGDPLTSAPTIAGGFVLTSYPAQGQKQGDSRPRPTGMTHALAAFDLRTGKLAWTRWLDADVMSAPVAVGDSVYAATFAGTIVELELDSGELRAARRDRATSAPTIAGGSMYYSKRSESDTAKVAEESIARSSKSGSWVGTSKQARYLDWNVQSGSKMASKGKALDSSNGFGGGAPSSANAEAARRTVGQGSVSTMQTFQGSRVLSFAGKSISSMGDEVVCTIAETGKDCWRHRLAGDLDDAGGFLATAPVAAGGALFVATLAGDVLQLDPDDGDLVRRHRVGTAVRSQPIVDDGWIYIGTDDGQLVGIDLHDPKYSGWSQWGGDAARTGAR